MPRKSKTQTGGKTSSKASKVSKTSSKTAAATPVASTTSNATATKSQSGGRAPNPWLVHVKQVKAANPDLKFKDVLIKAKESYTKVSKKE